MWAAVQTWKGVMIILCTAKNDHISEYFQIFGKMWKGHIYKLSKFPYLSKYMEMQLQYKNMTTISHCEYTAICDLILENLPSTHK